MPPFLCTFNSHLILVLQVISYKINQNLFFLLLFKLLLLQGHKRRSNLKDFYSNSYCIQSFLSHDTPGSPRFSPSAIVMSSEIVAITDIFNVLFSIFPHISIY